MKEFDFVVIGSGIAGLTFAIKAAKHGRVAIITKRQGVDSNTAWAQGGVACVTSGEDSFELHIRDTLEAGAGLCDPVAVETVVKEGPERVRELMELGLHFDERDVAGHRELDLGREGGHSKRRVLHVHDLTGYEIETTLLRAVQESPNIELLENHMAVDLITAAKLGFATEDHCLGVYVLDETSGAVETIRTDRLVLATGGCGKVYLYTTNPAIATGDGVAMAWRAGAVIANMEFIQFHPTCLFHPQATSFLISEAVRGEGGILRNGKGDDFMARVHPRGSLAPRDIVARAIDAEMKRTGRAMCLSRHHASAARVPAGAFPAHLRDLSALRHRHGEGTDPGRAGGALPMRRNQNEHGRRDQSARSLRDRRSGLHWFARRKSTGEQFAPRRPGHGSSRVRRRSSQTVRRPIRPDQFRCRNGSRATRRTSTNWSSSITTGTKSGG